MIRFRLMARGFISTIMDGLGNLRQPRSMFNGVPIMTMGDGLTRMPAGIGTRDIHGAGRLFIMEDGHAKRAMDGFGCREIDGLLLGFHGDIPMHIVVGHPCLLLQIIAQAWVSPIEAHELTSDLVLD